MRKTSCDRLVLAASLMLAALGAPEIATAQILSDGKPVRFLWEGQKSPVVDPRPSNLADTSTYAHTDTTRNSWLVAYPAENPNGAAIILIPGGGYFNLAGWPSEGIQGANQLTHHGITVFILHYRVDPYRHPHPMWDAQRAVRWVRASAAEYGIDLNRVGVLGFSAGGHVASTVATHYDDGLPGLTGLADTTSPHWYPGPKDAIDAYSSRPDFQALVYPMTTMDASFAYNPGRGALLGNNPSQELVDYLSNEKQVTPETPPAWINWGSADNLVNPLNSTVYRDSLASKGVDFATVVVPGAGHAFSTARLDSLVAWLDEKGFLSPAAVRAGHRPSSQRHQHSYVPRRHAPDALGRTAPRPTGPRLSVPLTEHQAD